MYFRNIWAELSYEFEPSCLINLGRVGMGRILCGPSSYEFGPSCLINLGRVGMGRVLCGPSWHGPSWFWAELSVIRYLTSERKTVGIAQVHSDLKTVYRGCSEAFQ